MSPEAIMKRLIDHVGAVHTITLVAKRIKVERSRVSATIHYLRKNEDVRFKLRSFGIRFNDALLRTPSEAHKHTKAARAGRNKAKKNRRAK